MPDFFTAAPLLRGFRLRFGHHSCSTSSDGAAASTFNSYRDIPQCAVSAWTTHLGRYPQESSHWTPDAILLTHSHDDHLSLASIVIAARNENVPVIVPEVPTVNLLSPYDMAGALGALGQRAVAPRWGETLTVGDFEIDILPFYGEQPTQQAPGAAPGLRNWGNCYRVQCPEFSAIALVDSGVDPMGSQVDAVGESCKKRGPVDVVLSCCASFVEAINPGLPHYALALPFSQLRDVFKKAGSGPPITLGADGVAATCAAAKARYFLPYAHGFRGIGADPASPETLRNEAQLVDKVAGRLTGTQIAAWLPGDVASFSQGHLHIDRQRP